MNPRIQRLVPAFVCLLVLPFCALWINPVVELGIIDDWSYIRSAQVLAQTGHVVYNGWATAMLGWQLYFGALLIKLFGFSFTTMRMGTLLASMVTALLMQRTMVRLGISVWNSTAVTVVFLISPLFLAVTFTFMSDVYGMLVLVACLACCLRALEAESDGAASAWICAAALGTAIGGTARQTGWVGLVAMVPSTLWLLRRRRLVLWRGLLFLLLGVVFMVWSVAWFSHQPFAPVGASADNRLSWRQKISVAHDSVFRKALHRRDAAADTSGDACVHAEGYAQSTNDSGRKWRCRVWVPLRSVPFDAA